MDPGAAVHGIAGARLLVVEDDEALSSALADALRIAGSTVLTAGSGEEALRLLESSSYDGVVLDIGLPGIDGFEVISRLRAMRLRLPVIFLTARDAVEDRVRGLMQGADDYMVKPFELAELLARLHVLLRRRADAEEALLTLGRLTMDLRARRAFVDGAPVELPLREWCVLQVLLANKERILSKNVIAEHVVAAGGERPSDNAIDVYVSRLRARLQPAGITIRTVRGFGYLVAEDRPGGPRAPRAR
jgi:DNA-binding response OmpR family regulator